MKRLLWPAVLLVSAAVLVSLLPRPADAVPAFARRHKLSCTTCHAPFPKLKDYGDEFAGDGFYIPKDDKDRDYIDGGDTLLRLSRDFPLAARFDAYALYHEDHEVENDLQIPWGLKLLSGGPLYKQIGYYFYFYMSERGEVAGIEDAYIHFNNLFGAPFDIMVGQFQTSDPLMKRELRLSYEDYMLYKQTVGDSRTNLAYDRGLMMTYSVEATGTDLVAFVVNGNGKPEAGDNRKLDDDKYKNIGARINQALGEIGSVGFFAYAGREEYLADVQNEIFYFGPDLNLSFGPVELTGQYLRRTDSNPVDYAAHGLAVPGEDWDLETDGIVAEMVFSPFGPDGRWFFLLLYNSIEADVTETHVAAAALASPDYETLTGGASYLLARNLRLMMEVTHDLEEENTRALVGLVGAF